MMQIRVILCKMEKLRYFNTDVDQKFKLIPLIQKKDDGDLRYKHHI